MGFKGRLIVTSEEKVVCKKCKAEFFFCYEGRNGASYIDFVVNHLISCYDFFEIKEEEEKDRESQEITSKDIGKISDIF